MTNENSTAKRKSTTDNKLSTGTKILYLTVAGGGAAALLTYLFAPETWRKFTAEISGAARQGWNKTGEFAGQIGAEAQTLYNRVGTEAQTLYGQVKTEAGVIYNAAEKELSSAEAAIAGVPKDLQDEKARITAGYEAGKKAYNSDSGSSSRTAAAANAN